MIDLPLRAQEVVEVLRELSKAFKNSIRALGDSRDARDPRDQAVTILSARAIRLADAFRMLAEGGYGEAAAATARALYETELFMRWVISDRANAQRFFEAAEAQGAKIARALLKQQAARDAMGPAVVDRIERVLATGPSTNQPPRFADLAAAVDCTALHGSVYPALSAMAHPNFLGLGEALVSRKITFDPSADNLNGLLGLVALVFRDCLNVYGIWMGQRRIAEVPSVPTVGANAAPSDLPRGAAR